MAGGGTCGLGESGEKEALLQRKAGARRGDGAGRGGVGEEEELRGGRGFACLFVCVCVCGAVCGDDTA